MLLVLMVVGLLGWLSSRYFAQSDWTRAGRNSVSDASRTLLARLDGPLRITAYAREGDPTRRAVRQLVARYQRVKPDIVLRIVDPDRAPDAVRADRVRGTNEMVVHYQGRRAPARSLTERALSNAVARVARAGARTLVYLTGHGERDLLGRANQDLGVFGARLAARGFEVRRLDLAAGETIPERTRVLVLSTPAVALLAGEIEQLLRYLRAGGNLLWLGDPGGHRWLAPLARELGVEFMPGTVVDPGAGRLGIRHPAVVPVTRYPAHPALRDFRLVTVFPFAAALRWRATAHWKVTPLLRTGTESWLETGPLSGSVSFDPGHDTRGPLTIGIALRRQFAARGKTAKPHQQRVVVVGDGDFLANAYIGNGGDLDLGLALLDWIAGDDNLLAIRAPAAPDARLQLSRSVGLLIGFGALFGLPLLLAGTGVGVWLRRRKR